MKAFALLVSLSVVAADSHAQGTFYFANHVSFPGGLDVEAPVFAGDGITRLSGDRYQVQLYVGNEAYTLKPCGNPVGFMTGAQAGYFDEGVVTIHGISPGSKVAVQVLGWDSTTGSSYETASIRGESVVFNATTGGGGDPPSPPGYLFSLQSFTIPFVPEPSSFGFFVLGGLLLAFGRRRV